MNQEMQDKREEIQQNMAELEQLIQNYDSDTAMAELQKVCSNWMNMVFSKIQNRQYELAATGFYDLFNKNKSVLLNADSAILDFMFRIHKKEMQHGEESILRLLTSVEQMRHIYFELKFLIRRFEYDLPDELKEELFSFLQQYPISAYAICEMIETYVSKKEKVLNDVAAFLSQKECHEHVPLLLSAAQERRGGDLLVLSVRKTDERKELSKLIKPDKPEKIAFILCVNDDRQFGECRYYIEHLLVPEGYSVEVIPVYHAKSMTSGYQQGMQKTDAKYKIYMHQDVLCTNAYLLYDLISIFNQNSDIGLVGVAGCIKMSNTGVWWQTEEGRYYNLYQDAIDTYIDNTSWAMQGCYNCGEYQEVQAVDGVFLATSKDVDWREDLFDGWHHYDISQSMEFQRKGYKVVIPKPRSLWVLHTEKKCNGALGKPYWQSTLHFLKEYMEDLLQ